MKTILRTLILTPALAAAAALATTSAKAEQIVQVPFSFTAAGHVMPAGTYTIQRSPLQNSVTLASMDATKHCTWLIGAGEPNPMDTRVILRFDEFGASHELQSVQYGSKITARLDRRPRKSEYVPTRVVTGE